jgi:hypothetical protein
MFRLALAFVAMPPGHTTHQSAEGAIYDSQGQSARILSASPLDPHEKLGSAEGAG